MIVKVKDKVYPFDDYLDIYNSVQKLAEECYEQGRADMLKEKNCKECYSKCLDCDKRIKAYQEGKADGINEFAEYIKKEFRIGVNTIDDVAKRFKEQNNE